MYEANTKWAESVAREVPLERRENDIRSEFGRDYTRILHSLGYRRLKHKTQVFPSPENDHICTRIEHVNHVESASFTIAQHLALNTELTKAIATGHDLGHAPFGHLGEGVLSKLTQKELGESFWHERNGLHFVDDVELLKDTDGRYRNLCLTYAVRDGIIAHCGEVELLGLKPRDEYIDLHGYLERNQHNPFTWEGCVVKMADKIAYLGRDIEDAILLGVIGVHETDNLVREINASLGLDLRQVNTTTLMHKFITDLCLNSSVSKGLVLSGSAQEVMGRILEFNYAAIYGNERLNHYKGYAENVIFDIFAVLSGFYDGENTKSMLENGDARYSGLLGPFIEWIAPLWDLEDEDPACKTIYNVSNSERDYKKAIIDYIAGMTDSYAKSLHTKICFFS
ncbi:MAG: HD domain-containing protein [Actinobacteria bacterium]|nr:HD domain-containing protein [Actinomycetota bacterium]